MKTVNQRAWLLAFSGLIAACAAQTSVAERTGDENAPEPTAQELRAARPCRPRACGPQLGLPNYLCPDGVTVAGPSGNCLRQPEGTCAWEVITCPCVSSEQCPAGEYCTTEDGVCNPPPGCGPGDPCPAVCYGSCAPKPADPCAGKRCGDPCEGPFGSPLPTYCDERGQCRPLPEPPACRLYDCDLSHVLCDALEPSCPIGQTPSVAGSCYGPCVPVEQCKCSPDVPTSCPEGYVVSDTK